MVKRLFDFETQYEAIKSKIQELQTESDNLGFDIEPEIRSLQERIVKIKQEKYKNLAPWEKVLLSRQAVRPLTREYIELLFEDWIELHGDRCFSDDKALIGGIAFFEGQPVTILGHQKGKSTRDNLARNFGMPHPDGYRKTQRLLLQAEKFHRPVITFIDTPGAYPGIGAEERGQSWAIAEVLMTLAGIKVPVVAIVVGEGGSGGALALAVSDRLFMLSNAVFSVASPEASASILWKDAGKAEDMARALKLTAQELEALKMVDGIIEEPLGGAALDVKGMIEELRIWIRQALNELKAQALTELLNQRYNRLRNVGIYG